MDWRVYSEFLHPWAWHVTSGWLVHGIKIGQINLKSLSNLKSASFLHLAHGLLFSHPMSQEHFVMLPETLWTQSSWLPLSPCHSMVPDRFFSFSFSTIPATVSLPTIHDATVHHKELNYCMKPGRFSPSSGLRLQKAPPTILLLSVNLPPAFSLQNRGCMITHLSSVHQIYGALLKCHKSTTMSHLALSSIAIYQGYLKIEDKAEKWIHEYFC